VTTRAPAVSAPSAASGQAGRSGQSGRNEAMTNQGRATGGDAARNRPSAGTQPTTRANAGIQPNAGTQPTNRANAQAQSRNWNGGNWNGGNWNGGNWNGGGNWNRNWNGGYANRGYVGPNGRWTYPQFGNYGYGGGYGYPGLYFGNRFGYGNGIGFGFGTGYGLGGFGIPGLGFGGYGLGGRYGGYGQGYYPGYYGGGGYANGGTVYSQTPAPESYVSAPATETSTGNQFLEAARTAFLAGDYAEAQRQANHAIVEMPDQPKSHEMISLAMFAQGDFAGAAAAAHAAVELGSLPDWPTLYGYYNDRDKYIAHLQKLKQHVQDHPDAPEGRFLLGLHNAMMGNRDAAKEQLGEYLKLTRFQDPVATRLYGDVGGDVSALPKPEAVIPAAPQNIPATDESSPRT